MEEAIESVQAVHEQLNDLGSIAVVAAIAVALGLVFVRLRQPPIVGYILAGLVLGPTGLGLVEQSHSITLLAELGVLLLLFLIGMELSIRAFVLVLAPALLVAGGQLAVGLIISFFFGWLLGWDLAQILILAFIVALSSTAVAIKVLDDIGELRTETGRITVGVLIAQDIAIVPMLIIANALGGDESFGAGTLVPIFLSVAFLGALIWYLNKPGKIRLPFSDQLTGKPDMMALAALALCFCAGAASTLFGLSPVYGAFIAGLIVANSTLRAEAIELTYPVQSILVFVFFLSIGLLIDLDYIMNNWLTVLTFTAVVIAAKTALNIALIHWTGFKWEVAFPAGLAMAQIGEFSFILAAVGFRNGAIDFDTYRLALAIIALSLMVSPIWMVAARRFHDATASGLNSFREALAETYQPELEELLRGRNRLTRARYRGRAYVRAMRSAAKKRKETKAADGEEIPLDDLPEMADASPQPPAPDAQNAPQEDQPSKKPLTPSGPSVEF